MTNTSALEHLRLARAALEQQRREVSDAISALDRVMAGMDGAQGGAIRMDGRGSLVVGEGASKSPNMTVREAITRTVASRAGNFSMKQLIDGVHAQGLAVQDDAVRSIAIKMLRSGHLERPGRGVYSAASPTSTEGPTADTVEPSEGFDEGQKGGDAPNGSANHNHRDDLSGRNGDRDRGASVAPF